MASVMASMSGYLALLVIWILLIGFDPLEGQSVGCDPVNCALPGCYCQYDVPPVENPPQVVLFTYAGTVADRQRETMKELFPDSVKNPNGCPVGITLFVVGSFSDDCAVHRMYVRGHEVALGGMNVTGLVPPSDWYAAIGGQRSHLVENAYIGENHIVGMRAQKQKPGGDAQLQMLYSSGFTYDSSLSAGPHDNSTSDVYPWPFTLDTSFRDLGFRCRTGKQERCPYDTYPGFWEIPATSLIGPSRSCAVLDDCIVQMSGDQVANFLFQQFMTFYRGTRAPMQINIFSKTLENQKAKDGIKSFLKRVTELEDVWIITMQELLAYMADPTSKRTIPPAWDCEEKRVYNKKCDPNYNRTLTKASLRDVMDVETIWIWQTAILIGLYIIIIRYDRMQRAQGNCS